MARMTGCALGFGELVAWALSGKPPVSGVMTFAAGLVAFPNAVGAHQERQQRRGNRHERH